MIRDLGYPTDARKVVESLRRGLEYDAAVACMGIACQSLGVAGDKPDLAVGIKFGGRSADAAVRREAPGLLSRFAIISMISRFDRNGQLLLLQRRVLEELGGEGKRMTPDRMWSILKQVDREARSAGCVGVWSRLVVTNPPSDLAEQMDWLDGLVRVRNCLAHRLGIVQLQDVKPRNGSIEDTTDDAVLAVRWLRIKASLNGEEVKEFPHKGGGELKCTFETSERQWKIGDHIQVTPQEAQSIALSLSLLAVRLLGQFEQEMNAVLGVKARP